MKLNRAKNATRNIIFGTILKVYQILVPFIMRTIMIYFLGAEYLGLNSLFVSVLQVLNLAELGVGSAMTYSMYKPIAEDDKVTICALMRLYKVYYRVIGIVVLGLGIIILPFIPKLIEGDIPSDINIYILYLLNLSATVLSYWLFAYKNSILTAHQRTDVTSKVLMITETMKYVMQILALVVFRNYYYYVITILITQAVTNIVTAYFADKKYPEYKPQGNLPKEMLDEINRRIRDLFTSKLGYVIINSVDTIVISAFLGLTALAIYQNYYYLITSVTGFITIIFTSCTAGIGNSLIVESEEKNFCDLKKVSFLISWIAGIGFACFLCLYQPFMELWVGKKLMLEFPAVVCFCIYFYIAQINSVLNLYKDAAGVWHEDRLRPLTVACINLLLNLLLVKTLGIYGVKLATIISTLVVGMPWLLHNLFTVVFSKKYAKEYILKLLTYALISIVAGIVSLIICENIEFPLIVTIIVRLLICCIIPNVIFLLSYHETIEFKQSLVLVDKMTKGKLKFLGKLK